MGGLYSTLAEGAGKLVSKLPGMDEGAAKAVESGAYSHVFSEARAFEQHPYANKIYEDYQKIYRPAINQQESAIGEASRKAGVAKSMPMISREAQQKASDTTFGKNQVRLQTMLNMAKRDKGVAYADGLSNHLNVMLKGNQIQEGPAAGLSTFDINMRKRGTMIGGGDAGALAQPYETPPTPYKGRNAYEKYAGPLRGFLAWGAAPIHAATAILNTASDAGLVNLTKTLGTIWGPGRQAAIAELHSSHALSEFTLDELKQHEAFNSGLISKYQPDSAGEFIHRNMYIPGMHAVRRESLLLAAHTGKLMAKEAAARLQQGDERFALTGLKSLGLDPNKIKRNNFQLDSDDIRQAFYHGANNKVFLNPNDKTPIFWRSSPLFRAINAFHAFSSSQFAFERALIAKQHRQGDFVGIARNLALKSLVYPAVGAALVEIGALRSGNDWDDPLKHLENREEYTPAGMIYDAIAGRENAINMGRTAQNTMDLLGRIGVWGPIYGHLQAAQRGKLEEAMLPADARIAAAPIQDAIQGHGAQMARDVLNEIPLGLGHWPARHFFPTKAQKRAEEFHRPSRRISTKDNFSY